MKKLIVIPIIIVISIGCSLQYGIYNPKDLGIKEIMDNKGSLAANIFSPPFLQEKLNVNVGIEYWKVAKYGTQLTSEIGLYDFYTSMRFYPIGARNHVFFGRPYAGGGIGYYNLKYSQESRGEYVGPAGIPGWAYYESNWDSNSLANGLSYHGVIGMDIPIIDEFEFFIEDRIDFGKSNNGIDLSGNILLFGFRYNPWY